MKTLDIKQGLICAGDYISDDGMREVSSFTIHGNAPHDATVHFTDGGCMGIGEVDSTMIFLESEVTG